MEAVEFINEAVIRYICITRILFMKIRISVFLLCLTLFTVALSSSGCYAFRKKNRCGDCPKWK
ncbi:MAG: hypothetical protein K0S44_3071 [Bacteroidetes bacterium]|nr:hypothetical protein [Bacteroidota bacterium]